MGGVAEITFYQESGCERGEEEKRKTKTRKTHNLPARRRSLALPLLSCDFVLRSTTAFLNSRRMSFAGRTKNCTRAAPRPFEASLVQLSPCLLPDPTLAESDTTTSLSFSSSTLAPAVPQLGRLNHRQSTRFRRLFGLAPRLRATRDLPVTTSQQRTPVLAAPLLRSSMATPLLQVVRRRRPRTASLPSSSPAARGDFERTSWRPYSQSSSCSTWLFRRRVLRRSGLGRSRAVSPMALLPGSSSSTSSPLHEDIH